MKFKDLVIVLGLFFVAENAMAEKTCQTAGEIKAYFEQDDTTAEEFCFHTITNPEKSLHSHKAIDADHQLASGLEVAFLKTEAYFGDAQRACASLGNRWHAPRSFEEDATPLADNNSNSLEGISKYFEKVGDITFWSSSTLTVAIDDGLVGTIQFGNVAECFKGFVANVLCVRP